MLPSPSGQNHSWFLPSDLEEWQSRLQEANRHNVFCHCKQCGAEWIASDPEPCGCGSYQVEHILCWQFPDD